MARWRDVPRARPAYGRRPWPAPPLPSPPEGTFHLPGGVPPRQVLALVVGPLATAHPQLDLDLPTREVQRERDEREPALGGLAGESVNLLPVQQQLTGPPRLMVGPGSMRVLRDVDPEQPDLPVGDLAEPVRQGRTASAQRLHLGAGEDEAGLHDILDVIIVPRLAVAGNHPALLRGSHGHGGRPPHARR